MRFHLSITSHFHSSQHGEFSQSIEDIYLSDSSRACVQNLDCIVREMRKPASRILTLIRKRTNDLHIVFLRRCCPIIVTRMKFELSSCPAPIRNSTPAHSRFRFLRLVITSLPLLTVFTTFHVPFSMSSPPSFDARCIQLCTREIPGCRGFNRDF